MDPKKGLALLVLPLACSLLWTACGGPTDRDKVVGLVRDLGRFAEARDTTKILARLAEDYSDFEGRDKHATREMLDEYFRRYRGIAINILRSQIDDLSDTKATVQSDLAFSSGAAKVFRKLAQISLDNYRLKLSLRKTGEDWLLTYSEWRPLNAGELLSGPQR
jgi:hypothetical protein